METVTIYSNQQQQAIEARHFSPELINDFITWIDRSPKTARTYTTNLKQFLAWLRFSGIRNPQRPDIILYREWLLSEHDAITLTADNWEYRTDTAGNPIKVICKPNTAAQYLRSVSQFFKWTAANNLYPDIAANIHAPKVTHTTHRKDAFSFSEIQTIETSITAQAAQQAAAAGNAAKDKAGRIQRSTEQGKRLYAMYLLAVNCGLRTIEISRANVKDLETKGGQSWLYIWGKGHTEPDQKKAVAPEVAAAIRDYISSRTDRPTGNSPLFVSTGNRSRGKRIAGTTISTMLKRAMQAAGFDSERLTAHSLRHSTGIAVMELTGNNIYLTQKYMRHSNPATTEIYINSTAKEEQQAADLANNVYDLFHGQQQPQQVEQIIDGLTPEQLRALAKIALNKIPNSTNIE